MVTYTMAFKWNDWEREIPKIFTGVSLNDVINEGKTIIHPYATPSKKAILLVREMNFEENKIVHEEEIDINIDEGS